MPRVPRADDHAGDARLIEHPAHRHGADADTMTRGNVVKRRKQSLKLSQPPNSSMISRYFTSERFSSGAVGSAASSHRSERNPPASAP